jgi:hypothetical protein
MYIFPPLSSPYISSLFAAHPETGSVLCFVLMLLFRSYYWQLTGRVPEAAPLLLAPWDIVMTFLSMFFSLTELDTQFTPQYKALCASYLGIFLSSVFNNFLLLILVFFLEFMFIN